MGIMTSMDKQMELQEYYTSIAPTQFSGIDTDGNAVRQVTQHTCESATASHLSRISNQNKAISLFFLSNVNSS